MHINYLINLLKQDKIEYEMKLRSLLEVERMVRDLENNCLSLTVKKYLKQKYRLNLTRNNVSEMLEVIKTDLFVLREKYKFIELRYLYTSKSLSALEFRQTVSPDLLDFIKNRLVDSGFTNSDIIKIIEYIKIRNTNIVQIKENRSLMSSADLFLIINMLNSGYEDIFIKDNKNSKNLDLIAKSIICFLDEHSSRDFKNTFNLDNIYSSDDLTYIYSIILKHYQEEIFRLVNVLKDTDFYFDIQILQEIKDDYKIFYQKYMFIRGKLDALSIKKHNEDLNAIEENVIRKNLYYLTANSIDPLKCYFMKDLLSIREESLSEVEKLLTEFKDGKTSHIKYLSGHSGFIELKSDQIRIVLKHLHDDSYMVHGIFIKKDDNDRESYNKICNRTGISENLEYSKEVEYVFLDYVSNNKRKGSR